MPAPDEAELRRRVEAGSQDAAEYCALARELVRQRRFDAAVRTYEQALEAPLPAADRARVLAELSRLVQVVSGRGERPLALAAEALTLLGSGPLPRKEWAVRGSAQAVAALCLAFRNPSASVDRACHALADLERAAESAPEPDLLALAGEMHLLLGEPEEALAWGGRYLSLETDACARARFGAVMARAFRLAGRLEEAERALAECLFHLEVCRYAAAALHHEQGLLYRAAGRNREARVALERAVGTAAEGDCALAAEIRISLGELCYDEGAFPDAAQHFEAALALLPDDVVWRRYALIWLGRSRGEMGACEQARECFAEVLASPEASDEEQTEAQRGALCAEAQQHYQTGDFRAAAKTYRRILDQNPADDEFRRTMLLWLADCCARTADAAGARACYEEILASSGAAPAERERALQDLAALPAAGRQWVH